MVPTLLTTPAAIQRELERLEIRYLGNTDANLRFALLTDFADASRQSMPEDAEYIDIIARGIEELNRQYGAGRFFLFHRGRSWSESDQRWIGWERKRGKLEQLNRFLMGESAPELEGFLCVGDRTRLEGIRFVITLDADTQLISGAARRMIETLVHPLNQAQLSPDGRRVIRGYTIIQPSVSATLPSAMATWFSRIFADPKSRDRVYALNTGFYRSDDGGKTFKTTIRPPHGDNHDLWIDPANPQHLVSSDDGGGTVSVNGGKTWTEQKFPTAQLYHVATTVDFPYQVCGAQQDNSTVCVQSLAVARGFGGGDRAAFPELYAVGGGESGYIAPDPKDANVFYAGSQGALLSRYDRRTGQTRDVEVFPRFFSGEAAETLPDRWQWTYPIVFDPLDPQTLYTSSQFVYKTTNQGQSWQKISKDLTRHDPKTLGDSGGPITHDMNGPEIFATVFTIAPSRKEGGTIWTGSDDGLVYITRDGVQNWTNVTPPDMPNLIRVSMIDASPHKPGTAYVAAQNYQQDDRKPYAWRTDDYGKTWTRITNGIAADDYLHVVREDTKRSGLLFAGADHGLYVSFDDGANWMHFPLRTVSNPDRNQENAGANPANPPNPTYPNDRAEGARAPQPVRRPPSGRSRDGLAPW